MQEHRIVEQRTAGPAYGAVGNRKQRLHTIVRVAQWGSTSLLRFRPFEPLAERTLQASQEVVRLTNVQLEQLRRGRHTTGGMDMAKFASRSVIPRCDDASTLGPPSRPLVKKKSASPTPHRHALTAITRLPYHFGRVRMKLLLLLACAALLVRSGPVPACLWDEIFLSWLSTTSEVTANSASCGNFDLPHGNDTAEELALDQVHHQSACNFCKVPTSLYPHSASDLIPHVRSNAISAFDQPTMGPSCLLTTRLLSPPPLSRTLPLLI
jgi:hypothetical protein